jgi:hypothetical protein
MAGVTPSIGSQAGGTQLTIRGSGFGYQLADVAVGVGSLRCAVRAVQNDQIECQLEHAPSGIMSARGGRGERGVRVDWWDGAAFETLPQLHAAINATPAGSTLQSDFQFVSESDQGGARLRGWLLAPADVDVSFVVWAPKAEAELWWSADETEGRQALLARTGREVSWSWPSWPVAATETRIARSQRLVAGRAYYLELLCAWPTTLARHGRARCGAGMRVHSPSATLPTFVADPNMPQHPSAHHAEQSLTFAQQAPFVEVQTIDLAAHASADVQVVLRAPGVGTGASDGFQTGASAADIEAALAPLSRWQPCSVSSSTSSGIVLDARSFESAGSLWHAMNPLDVYRRNVGFSDHTIPLPPTFARSDRGEPYCGGGSMFLRASYAR